MPATAAPDPPWCCLPSLPDSRVPPGCHWQHKTCGWGQPHNGPHLMPLQCRAPTEQTEHKHQTRPTHRRCHYSDMFTFLLQFYNTFMHKNANAGHICPVDFPTIMYLVWREAVERSNWSKLCRLELTQVGQQRQLPVLVAALVFPVTTRCKTQDFDDGILTPSTGCSTHEVPCRATPWNSACTARWV